MVIANERTSYLFRTCIGYHPAEEDNQGSAAEVTDSLGGCYYVGGSGDDKRGVQDFTRVGSYIQVIRPEKLLTVVLLRSDY